MDFYGLFVSEAYRQLRMTRLKYPAATVQPTAPPARHASKEHIVTSHDVLGDSSPNAVPAVLKVFGTTELFERIVIELHDLRDIVNCRRVSRKWKSVIGSSVPLKQKLFLRRLERPTWEINPLLEHFLNVKFKAISYKNRSQRDWDWHFVGTIDVTRTRFPTTDGSWQKMLISQPPCMAINLLSADFDKLHLEGVSYPLRLGDLADAVDNMLRASEKEHGKDEDWVYYWSPAQLPLAINLQRYWHGKISGWFLNKYERLFRDLGFHHDYEQHGRSYSGSSGVLQC